MENTEKCKSEQMTSFLNILKNSSYDPNVLGPCLALLLSVAPAHPSPDTGIFSFPAPVSTFRSQLKSHLPQGAFPDSPGQPPVVPFHCTLFFLCCVNCTWRTYLCDCLVPSVLTIRLYISWKLRSRRLLLITGPHGHHKAWSWAGSWQIFLK